MSELTDVTTAGTGRPARFHGADGAQSGSTHLQPTDGFPALLAEVSPG